MGPRIAPLGYELAEATNLDGGWLVRIALIRDQAQDRKALGIARRGREASDGEAGDEGGM